MTMEVVELGASGLESSGTVWATCKGPPVDENDAPDYGKAPLAFALGFAARPWRKTDKGFAQGYLFEATGYNGVVVGANDPRTASTYGDLGEGETAVFATGEAFDSRAIFGDKVLSLIVGDNMVLQIDRNEQQAILSCPGGTLKISADNGALLCDQSGKAMVHLQDGVAMIGGQVVLGGRNPGSNLADAAKVDAEFSRIWNMFSSWTPVPNDGGAALKTLSGTSAAQLQSTKAEGIFKGS
jgi:hypothetical protein